MKTLILCAALATLLFAQDKPTFKNSYVPPAPVDVPAINISTESRWEFYTCGMSDACFHCTNNGHTATAHAIAPDTAQDPKCIGGWRWGCADKKRILLTAEDGSKHCLRFNFEEPKP